MIRRFALGDERLDFVCDRGPEQAEFWRTRAAVACEENTATIYVLPGDGHVHGFYAICMARVLLSDLPPNQRRRSLPNQCPAALLAQLGRDDRAPKGLGEALIGDAIERIVGLSNDIGCIGIILDAKNAGLVSYYGRLGFIPIGTTKNTTQRMFMGLKEARASAEAVR